MMLPCLAAYFWDGYESLPHEQSRIRVSSALINVVYEPRYDSWPLYWPVRTQILHRIGPNGTCSKVDTSPNSSHHKMALFRCCNSHQKPTSSEASMEANWNRTGSTCIPQQADRTVHYYKRRLAEVGSKQRKQTGNKLLHSSDRHRSQNRICKPDFERELGRLFFSPKLTLQETMR